MHVLVSNDDGFGAPGIVALEHAAREVFEEVTVVAPLDQQSGVSHGLTLNKPLYCKRVDEDRWGIGGRPADCVFLAMKKLVRSRPDLVISGINMGPNMGIDTMYSGTTGAAREGLMQGTMSAAFSYASLDHFDFDAVYPHVKLILQALRELVLKGTPPMMFNFNFPDVRDHSSIKGFKACGLGHRVFADNTVEWADPRGGRWFWVGGARLEMQGNEDTDTHWLAQGYVTVTPMIWSTYYAGGRGLAEEVVAGLNAK